MFVADASVWVGAAQKVDRFHDASRAWIVGRVSEGARLLEPTLLLPEVAGAIRRQTGRPVFAERWLSEVRAIPAVVWHSIDSALADRAAELSAALGVRGADAIYVALAEALDVPLVTWDRRRAFAAGDRALTPETA